MMTKKAARSHDDYMAVDHALYIVSGRCCANDPDEVCDEPDDPEYCVEIYCSWWREESAVNGRDRGMRASVVVRLDSRRRHASGSATLLFKATRMDFGDTPDGLVTGDESLAVASGWIEAAGLRVTSTRAGTSEEGHCAVAEVSDDIAIALLQSLAHGSLPTVGIQFAGDPTKQVFRVMKPMPRAQSIELRMMQMPQTPIRLDSVAQMPPEILRYLLQFGSVFSACEYIEQVLKNSYLEEIAAELDRLCVRNGVIGYHFTRAIPEDIASRGLELPIGARRRSDFLVTHGHLFSAAQREWICRMWEDYFDALQTRGRDGRIWFAFTLDALSNGGAHPLLMNFGGEAVYMPLADDKEIAAILQTIGQPLVVECELKPEKLSTIWQNSWGRTWLSSYHVTVNPRAHQHALEARLREPVSPSNLVGIRIPQRCGTKKWRA